MRLKHGSELRWCPKDLDFRSNFAYPSDTCRITDNLSGILVELPASPFLYRDALAGHAVQKCKGAPETRPLPCQF